MRALRFFISQQGISSSTNYIGTMIPLPAFTASCTTILRNERRQWTNSTKKIRFVPLRTVLPVPLSLPVSPRCCMQVNPSDSDSNDIDIEQIEREIPIVSVSMTAGGEVLFPGTRLDVEVPLEAAMRASDAINSEFGYLPIDAWNVPSSVGTICVVDEFFSTTDENNNSGEMVSLRAHGLERFRLVSLDDDRKTARIVPFSDTPTREEDMDAVADLEGKLVESMQEIVRLTMKIGGENDMDETHQRALNETLRRVEAFCLRDCSASSTSTELESEPENVDIGILERWGSELNADQRREILSFAVLDLLNLSFMSRRSLMMAVDTRQRLEDAIEAVNPYLKQLAAKGAILSALGKKDLS